MRRKAKAVNFGIIYGISAFGLAQDIGVSNSEAKRYIDSYFARYPRVREFIDRTIQDAKTNGFVTTLFGRRRFIPELVALRTMQEFRRAYCRQYTYPGDSRGHDQTGHAQDLRHGFSDERLAAKMILQVHDELVFEVPDDEIEFSKAAGKAGNGGSCVLVCSAQGGHCRQAKTGMKRIRDQNQTNNYKKP